MDKWYGNFLRKGAFHSTKDSEIFETGTNGSEISREKFQKIRKLLNFRKENYSTENSENSGRKVKCNGEKFPKISVYFGCVLFRKFGKVPLHSSVEISENSKQNFQSAEIACRRSRLAGQICLSCRLNGKGPYMFFSKFEAH